MKIQEMRILKKTFRRNPNIGLYMYVSDKFCLVPKWITDKEAKQISEIFCVPSIPASVAGTDLLGVFCAGNINKLLLPKITFEYEFKEMSEKLSKLGASIEVLDSEKTALGNLIKANDNGAIISPVLKHDAEKISKKLGVNANLLKIEEVEAIGALIATNNSKAVVSTDFSDEAVNIIESTLKVKALRATINFGQSYISSGLVLNSSGFMIGNLSTGVEITEIDNFLNSREN